MSTGSEKTPELGWADQALKNVTGDSVATVAIVAILAGTALLFTGKDPWIACGFPGAVCILYQVRSLFDHRHKRNMAEIEVKRIEAEVGKTVSLKAQKALARRQVRDGRR